MCERDQDAIAAALYLYAKPHMSYDQYKSLYMAIAEHFSYSHKQFTHNAFYVKCLHGTSVKQPHSVKIRA